MNKGDRAAFVAQKMMDATAWCKTMGDFSESLLAMSYTLGSLTVEFPEDEREQLFVLMVEMMGNGLQTVSKSMGTPSRLVMTKVERN